MLGKDTALYKRCVNYRIPQDEIENHEQGKDYPFLKLGLAVKLSKEPDSLAALASQSTLCLRGRLTVRICEVLGLQLGLGEVVPPGLAFDGLVFWRHDLR